MNNMTTTTTNTTPNSNDYIVVEYRIYQSGRAIYRGEQAQAIRKYMSEYPEDSFYEVIDSLVAMGTLEYYPEELASAFGNDSTYEYKLVEDGLEVAPIDNK